MCPNIWLIVYTHTHTLHLNVWYIFYVVLSIKHLWRIETATCLSVHFLFEPGLYLCVNVCTSLKSQNTSKYFLQATVKYDDLQEQHNSAVPTNERRILTCISWVCKSVTTWLRMLRHVHVTVYLFIDEWSIHVLLSVMTSVNVHVSTICHMLLLPSSWHYHPWDRPRHCSAQLTHLRHSLKMTLKLSEQRCACHCRNAG